MATAAPVRIARNGISWIRRIEPDRAQSTRRLLQAAFLALNLWIGSQFYLFVRQFETFPTGPLVERPAGVEGWLPIMGMMQTRWALLTGSIPVLHPAAMFLFLAFVTTSLLFRRAFCSWLCPVGTISEYLWKIGRNATRRAFMPPRWLDIPLRALKYILLGLFFYAVGSMSAPALSDFIRSPYGLMADVKMLDFFRHMSRTAAIVVAVLVLTSLFVPNAWCRYLCPYGALMGLVSWASPLRIRREPAKCIDCAKCAQACPSALKVDQLIQITSPECLGCMECVTSCPAEGALAITVARRPVAPQWIAAAIAVIFFSFTGYAKLTGHWNSPIPPAVYERLIPIVSSLGHP